MLCIPVATYKLNLSYGMEMCRMEKVWRGTYIIKYVRKDMEKNNVSSLPILLITVISIWPFVSHQIIIVIHRKYRQKQTWDSGFEFISFVPFSLLVSHADNAATPSSLSSPFMYYVHGMGVHGIKWAEGKSPERREKMLSVWFSPFEKDDTLQRVCVWLQGISLSLD